MDKYELQKLRDLPIEGVAERLGLRVTRGHKSLCPFHDDHTASLSYCVRKNTCRCFVCMNESMGTIDLVMKHLRMDFKEACKWLADSHNVILDDWKPISPSKGDLRGSFDASRYEGFFLRPWLSDEARKFLFDERHLDPRVINWCRVSSWRDRNGVNWLQIPYYDVDSKLIGVQNRNLQKGATPRFKFPYGSQCSIYNLQIVKRLKPGDELWITEGCSDCWAMLSAGHKAIAIPSATLLSPKDKELLLSLSSSLSLKWNMYPDKDAPGERLFLQLKEILPDFVHHHLPLACKDFSDYYVQLKSQ
ncbi:MAG: CHC2 zinc finger domain-containing protein [Paludibacteraceae bacterium]|nr:CHC2 zinc finger domain-containing protein [Paludibacteraceae bacterium]